LARPDYAVDLVLCSLGRPLPVQEDHHTNSRITHFGDSPAVETLEDHQRRAVQLLSSQGARRAFCGDDRF
jgi:hypothetical protein